MKAIDGIAAFAFASEEMMPDTVKDSLSSLAMDAIGSVTLRGPEKTKVLVLEAIADCPTIRGILQRYV